MKPFIAVVAVVLVALTSTAAACCLAGVGFWMGVANPNVLAHLPWPNNTITGWWCCFTGTTIRAVMVAPAVLAGAALTGRWISKRI